MADITPINGGSFVHDTIRHADGRPFLKRLSLKNKTAIISGSGGGIGFAVAEAYAELGCNVVVWYHSSKVAVEKAEALGSRHNVKCKAYQVDVRSYEAIQLAVDRAVEEFNGRLDIFVSNAGIPWTKGPMVDGPVEHYRDVVATDLDGTYYCAKAAAKHWRRQKLEGTDLAGKPLSDYTSGSFIATASMSGLIVNVPQLQAAYNAAKAGVIHLCRSLGVEWARYARANAISPGYIITEISDFVDRETKNIWKDKIPLGREGEPHELQGAFVYLASDLSTYTTGSNIVVDGGYSVP
ncbi:short-chain dehydrogenase/reductase [Grosmannia clavigera kw1407]|uniref:Short-chain dehydrogenase/reductase n=1 Tax=Grosmannia clavigera (strain kw1407 / UAMH 11150) TaxID=655863 RepID=F0XFF7_GROCL|nr:short-chain dehydrogenase/reductase [Grosmannia clavigera kw1407]EFX04738.1 short-chain dehydrogenase/reductase [Grosmannia clavigera kw1407]